MTIRWMQTQGEIDRGLNDEDIESEEYLNEAIDEALGFEEQPQEDLQQTTISEAQARIEQANLYQTIINHSLFAPNSARPEIMEIVEGEIRTYAIERLEILLGMKSSAPKAVQVESPFSEEEVAALKAIAGRLNKAPVNSAPIERNPGLNAVGAAPAPVAPALRQVAAPVARPAVKAQPKPAPVVAKPQPPKAAAAPATPSGPKVQSPKRRSRKVEDAVLAKEGSSRDYSQAVNPNKPPIPMPREIHITNSGGMNHTADSEGSFNVNQLAGMVQDALR